MRALPRRDFRGNPIADSRVGVIMVDTLECRSASSRGSDRRATTEERAEAAPTRGRLVNLRWDDALGRGGCLSMFLAKRVHVLAPMCDSSTRFADHRAADSRGSWPERSKGDAWREPQPGVIAS